MPYVFKVDGLAWSGKPSVKGELVPDDGTPGTVLATAERAGWIVSIPEGFVVMADKKAQGAAAEPSQPDSHAAQERAAGDRGLVTQNPPVPDAQEAEAGVQDLDHAGTGAPTRADAERLIAQRKAEQEAAAGEPRPLTADEQVQQGQTPAQPIDDSVGRPLGAEPIAAGGSEGAAEDKPAATEPGGSADTAADDASPRRSRKR